MPHPYQGPPVDMAMADPHKPRVIKTRSGAGNPRVGTSGPVLPVTAQPRTSRPTSTKVSVTPVPAEAPGPASLPSKPGMEAVPSPQVDTTDQGAGRKAFNTLRRKLTRPAAPARPVEAAPVEVVPEAGSEPVAAGQGRVLAFPMPEHKRRRRTIVLSTLAVVAVVVLVMAAALFSPALAVKKVVFDGQKLVSDKILQDAVAPLLSRPLPQVTGAEVEQLLKPIVQVKSSRIEARPPSTLVVHIVERVPVALLKNGTDYLLVDQDGVQLAATKDPASAALPLIDGGKAAIGRDTFRAVTAVLANLPQSILIQLANASATSPDAVELKLADGRSVIWGNASDMTLKAQVLEALLLAPPPTAAAGMPTPIPAKVFDVSAPRHPVTR